MSCNVCGVMCHLYGVADGFAEFCERNGECAFRVESDRRAQRAENTARCLKNTLIQRGYAPDAIVVHFDSNYGGDKSWIVSINEKGGEDNAQHPLSV